MRERCPLYPRKRKFDWQLSSAAKAKVAHRLCNLVHCCRAAIGAMASEPSCRSMLDRPSDEDVSRQILGVFTRHRISTSGILQRNDFFDVRDGDFQRGSTRRSRTTGSRSICATATAINSRQRVMPWGAGDSRKGKSRKSLRLFPTVTRTPQPTTASLVSCRPC